MKKRYHLPLLTLFISCLITVATCSASSVQAANFYMSPSSGTVDPNGTLTVDLKLNSSNANSYNLDSAVAIVTYDSSLVSISAANGTFFPNLSVDSSTTNEIALTGTLNFGDMLGVGGDQTFATLTLTPQATSGTITLAYRCSAADRNDSNIMALITGTTDTVNLLNTDTTCAANAGGTYTIGSSGDLGSPSATSTPTATPTTTSTNNTNSPTSTPTPTTSTTNTYNQPVTPTTLPQSGPEQWLMAIPFGLVLLLVGLAII